MRLHSSADEDVAGLERFTSAHRKMVDSFASADHTISYQSKAGSFSTLDNAMEAVHDR